MQQPQKNETTRVILLAALENIMGLPKVGEQLPTLENVNSSYKKREVSEHPDKDGRSNRLWVKSNSLFQKKITVYCRRVITYCKTISVFCGTNSIFHNSLSFVFGSIWLGLMTPPSSISPIVLKWLRLSRLLVWKRISRIRWSTTSVSPKRLLKSCVSDSSLKTCTHWRIPFTCSLAVPLNPLKVRIPESLGAAYTSTQLRGGENHWHPR